MNSHLEVAAEYAAQTTTALREANAVAGPVDHLVIMELLRRAAELTAAIDAYRSAVRAERNRT